MRLNQFLVVILLAVVGSMAACNTPSQPQHGAHGEVLSIPHKLGVTTISSQPSRIVVLDIGALETLHELGVTPIAIPKKFMPEYLNDLKKREDIADVGSVIEPDFEAIHAQKPDLILISARQERFYKELSDIAPTVFIGTDNKNYIASFKSNTLLLADIVGKKDVAQQKLDSLDAKIRTAQQFFDKDPNKGLFLIYNGGKFNAFGSGSRFGFIHDVLHIKPVMELKDESVHGQKVSNELIAEADPDYMFIVDRNAVVMDRKAVKTEIENPLIQQTKAFKNKKIFYLDPNVWFISGGGITSVNLMIEAIEGLIMQP
ncbi:siderophore ABC transporter substrate-binding protein [Sphingobacterium sp. Mn56C]|uniref:siderophore ABC transporter substrate-binding protein n=1 Tax=Sphingobacterium sp. Mn56C TaxID=3395261 RepID=UPI003BC5D912